MAKIAFDKYYTPPTVARWCINKAYEIIGKENITEVIEPSAGCGMFSHQIENCKSYDLYPQHEYIEQADFLELDLGGYKKGRLFIGNPPFGGVTSKLIKSFYGKCVKDGDYIAFILPSSFYNNYKMLYKFEIIYSVIIQCDYTNVDLKTSFTIYRRNPDKNDFREKKTTTLQDVKFIRYKRDNKKNKKHKTIKPYDYCFKVFGNPLLAETEPYRHASTIAININPDLKDEVINVIRFCERKNRLDGFMCVKCISSQNSTIEDIIKLLKICIPNIK